MASQNHELDELTKNEIKLGLKRKEYFYGEQEKQLEELRAAQNLPDDVYYEETSFGNYRFFNVVNESSNSADNDRLLQYQNAANIATIKKCIVFMTVLIIIGLVGGLIAALVAALK